MLATLNGHWEIMDKLLQHGARVDLFTKVLNYSKNFNLDFHPYCSLCSINTQP